MSNSPTQHGSPTNPITSDDALQSRWSLAAKGWSDRRDHLQALAQPVSDWMVDAISPQPGQTILELAAGVGDTGFMAAKAIGPTGRLITSDFSPQMLIAAKERAQELGVTNAEFKQINATKIDLPELTIDSVLCRWGYMLMPDAPTAFEETLRVLEPNGRVSLAAWRSGEENLWATLTKEELEKRDLQNKSLAQEPGPFTFAKEGEIERLLENAGFKNIRVETVTFEMRYSSFTDWWEMSLQMGRTFTEIVEVLPETTVNEIRTQLEERSIEYRRPDNSLAFPANTWVAVATK